MATMNRNLNLEEVNSDAFMGIQYLNYQTTGQKVIFWGSVVTGVALNLVSSFAFHLNTMVSLVLTLLPLLIGVAFGCNYNEDLSVIKYLYLLLFHHKVELYSHPTTNLERIRQSADRIKQEEMLEQRQQTQTPEEQKKLLIKLIAGVAIFVLVLIVALVVIALMSNTETDIHHTASACLMRYKL